jgi:hypothetical protein
MKREPDFFALDIFSGICRHAPSLH